MNRNNSNIPVSEGMKNIAEKRKSLTPAVLGMPNSHGVKLSVNMTSEDKKELLTKLEEWRKARKEKLAASILAKQKQVDKPKASVPSAHPRSKPVSIGGNGSSKFQNRQSVFERLYQSNGKLRKQEDTVIYSKQQQITGTNSRKSVFQSLDKPKKQEKVLPSASEKAETDILPITCTSDGDSNKIKQEPLFPEETSEQNCDIKSVSNTTETNTELAGNGCVEVTRGKTNEGVELTKPIHLYGDQVKIKEAKVFKGGAALESLAAKAVQPEKGKVLLRRSISMMFRQKSRTVSSVRRSISAKSLNEINLNTQRIDNGSSQPLRRPRDRDALKDSKCEAVGKSVIFATPRNTKLLTSTYLRTKLEDWLKVNGHSLEGYRHLRCFGITDSGKPAEAPAVASDDTFENSYYATAPNTPEVDSDKENVTPPTVVQQAEVKHVENWLEELHRLIVELKYPSERCEEWLTAIRKKYSGCSQLPIYWECLAALHESKGDLKTAIEDYERAIIKGGEVDTVGDSLAQLFDKLVIEQNKPSKPKLEKGLDPKNIFRSTIIKFALQQKAIKKLSSEIEPGVRQQLYIATPVRRSTRLQTPLKSSDEIASLQTLTPEFRKNVTFKPNESLLSGD